MQEAVFFGAIFNKLPTYEQINFGTHKNSPPPEVNELFQIRTEYKSLYGEPAHINLELLFNDLFLLRDRFKELGMTIKDDEVYLADLENKDV